MLKIVTDSCADMEENFSREHNITIAHLHLQVDGQDFTPGLDIDTDQALPELPLRRKCQKHHNPRHTPTNRLFSRTINLTTKLYA